MHLRWHDAVMLPDIADAGRRVARTILQAALAVISLAPVYPLIVDAIGAPADSNVGAWLIASVTWVGTTAGIASRIMAIPAVNNLLGPLAGHTGTEGIPVAVLGAEPPTDTTMMRAVTQYGGEFLGEPAH